MGPRGNNGDKLNKDHNKDCCKDARENAPTVPARQLWPLSSEQKFVHEWSRRIFSPDSATFLHSFVLWLFVAPFTNFTNVSLFYQMYLNQIVHRRFLTMLSHHICSPVILICLYAVCDVDLGLIPLLNVHLTGAYCCAALFSVWYTIWGLFGEGLERIPLLGPIATPSNFLIAFAAHEYGAHWQLWFGGSLFMRPIVQLIFWSFLQALSHAIELVFPPRACFRNPGWCDYRLHFSTDTLRKSIVYALQAIPGTVDEFLVTPRLHAVHMLNYVHFFTGYKDESMQKLYALVKEAVDPKHGGGKWGNAAVDYIGYGGDKFPWQAAAFDPTYELQERDSARPMQPAAA